MQGVDVVVIDDDEGVRWALQQVLSLGNITCKVADSGPRGIREVEAHRPSLAIVDIKLGSMNGLDVARAIYRICSKTRIIFVTGYGEEIREKIEDFLPVIEIVEKPFDVRSLLKLVQRELRDGFRFVRRNKRKS